MTGTEVVIYIFLVIIIIASVQIISKTVKTKNLKKDIVNSWGKLPHEKYDKDSIESISSYFLNLMESKNLKMHIDDTTWNDLNMDNVFKKINNTRSTVGEEYLYAALRLPVNSKSILLQRGKIIDFFQNNPDERNKLLFCFASLGKRRNLNITDYLFFSGKKHGKSVLLYRILSSLAIISVAVAYIKPEVGLAALPIMFGINAVIYYREKSKIGHMLESVNYITEFLHCAKKVLKLDIRGINEYNNTLKVSLKPLIGITKKSAKFLNYTGDILVEYVKIFLLKELIDFQSILDSINKNRNDFIRIYETLGAIDSLLAIASYRCFLQFYTIPDLNNNKNIQLNTEEIYHPLLNEPIANSIKTEKPVLLTGSNASGKSTFLKTIAINAIFAQTIYTCLAQRYVSNFCMVFTSMALKDDILSNESYYIAEIKSLKRILDNLNQEIPCFIFIDEVLRGTNTVERISASSEILFYLSKKNCLCFAATHDIELASILAHYYKSYHFQENIKGDEIYFDYKLYPEKSTTRNAIKLLKLMGYSQDIVEQAELKANEFLSLGKWNKMG